MELHSVGQQLSQQRFVFLHFFVRKLIKMEKLFKENGMLSAAGEDNFAQFLDGDIIVLLNDAEDESELRLIGSLIQQRVGKLVTDAIQSRRGAISKLSKMTDAEFETYLEEKYGSKWRLKSLTPEEFERFPKLSKEKIEDLLEEGKKYITEKVRSGMRFPYYK